MPTNRVVLEIVRDEIGRVSWLCSVGSGGEGGWLGLSAEDALAAFGVWGVLMETEPAEDSSPPHKIWPLTPIPKARMVPTSAVGRGEPLNPIPGVGDWGIWVWDRSRVQSHSPMWPPGGPSELRLG